MRQYVCEGMATNPSDYGSLCGCRYREVGEGVWEYRYDGPGYGITSGWVGLPEKTLKEIEAAGHRLIEIEIRVGGPDD